MAQLSEPGSPAFVVVVSGSGLRATALAVLVSAPIAVVTAHRDPDCVILVGADEPGCARREPLTRAR
jgi:molybdopterin biosynthesis enzyme